MKQIVVPLSPAAMHRLDLDQCLPGDLEQCSLSTEHYQQLWDSGLIERLNRQLGCLIDEHEDASIQGAEALATAQALIEQTPLAPALKTSLLQLTTRARAKASGLFFYF